MRETISPQPPGASLTEIHLAVDHKSPRIHLIFETKYSSICVVGLQTEAHYR